MNFIEVHPKHAKSLKSFVYKGADLSYLYNYALSDLAAYFVNVWTPRWVAPNTITLLGLVFPILTLFVALYYQPMMGTGMPNWVAFFCALSMFIYSTMDNMDGKQARKTGSSSALGLLFDHGCDAVNAALVNWANIALIAGTHSPVAWQSFIWFLVPVVPFFFASWEEKFTGEFVLPVVNGPNEGIFLCISLMLAQSWMGQAAVWALPLSPNASSPILLRLAFWVAAPIIDIGRWVESSLEGSKGLHPVVQGAPGSLSYASAWISAASKGFVFESTAGSALSGELISTCVFTIGALTALSQVVGVLARVFREKGLNGSLYALSLCAPFFLIIFSLASWLFTPGLPRSFSSKTPSGWLSVYGTAGVFFVESVIRIMLSFLCQDDIFLPGATFLLGRVLPFAALPSLLSSATGKALVSQLGGEKVAGNFFLCAAFFYGALFLAFIHSSTTQCAQALGIKVFSIQKQLAAQQKPAAPSTLKSEITEALLEEVTGRGAGALPTPPVSKPQRQVSKSASKRATSSRGMRQKK